MLRTGVGGKIARNEKQFIPHSIGALPVSGLFQRRTAGFHRGKIGRSYRYIEDRFGLNRRDRSAADMLNVRCGRAEKLR